MKELLTIRKTEFPTNGLLDTVNARDLYDFLESKQTFSAWIKKRLMAYGFEEDRDFCIERVYTQYGQLDKIDYHLTIDTAKELSMIERNLKGREARKYFIECEKRFKAIKEKVETQPLNLARLPVAQFDAAMIEIAINLLKPSDNSKLMMVQKLFDKHGADKTLLPAYTEKVRAIFSASKLLKDAPNCQMTIHQFNKKMIEHGFIEKKTRQSRKTESKTKEFLALTEKGLKYGQNDTSPQNPLETQPHYYEDSFGDLVKILTIGD